MKRLILILVFLLLGAEVTHIFDAKQAEIVCTHDADECNEKESKDDKKDDKFFHSTVTIATPYVASQPYASVSINIIASPVFDKLTPPPDMI